MEKALNKIIKYGLYSLIFLLPLFFLPWTIFPVALNKQMLLAVFVFLLLIFWLVKIISSGRLSFVWNKLTLAVLLLLLVLGISTAFSSSKVQSFWGMAAEPDTLFNFILFALVFFLFANLLKEKEEISKVIFSFLLSSGILSLLFLIQSFKPIFPWDFAQSPGFNPIGSVQGLSVFLGGAFVILMAVLTNTKFQRLYKILGGIIGILLFIAIFLINFWAVWLGIAFGLAIIIFRMLKKLSAATPPATATNPLRPLLLPLLIFVLALVFVFLRLPIGNIVALPAEISPTYQATFDISTKTLTEGPKDMILGSGPATFGYQYSLHRGIGPNLTNFWQIRFNQGAAVLPTFLTTSGILGILAILFLLVVFFWQGLKTLMYTDKKRMNADIRGTQFAVFAGGFYFLILWFFYSVNFSLLFAVFLMMGLFAASAGNLKEFSFTQSPQKAFTIMLLGVFLIAGSIFGLYTISQKYAGAIVYAQGLSLIAVEEPKLDEGIIKIDKAVNLDPKDAYFRNLSQAFLLKINEVLANEELSQEQMQAEFQQHVSNAELAATAAVQINPKNSQNWFQLASIYENLAIFGVEGARQLAVLNYQEAAEMDPQNPQLPLNIGRVYKTELERLKVQLAVLEASEDVDQAEIEQSKEVYSENFDLSMEYFNKSAELKPNFSAAYYLIAQNYETNDEKEKALENYQIVLQLEPENEEIQKKVEELQK